MGIPSKAKEIFKVHFAKSLHCLEMLRWMQISRVLYSIANDPETANDPQNGPQMILDHEWLNRLQLADHRINFIVITKSKIKR